MWKNDVKRVAIVFLIIIWNVEEILSSESHTPDAFVIPFTNPKDCVHAKCFDPIKGVCRTPGTCFSDSRNETLGKWSDCFLTCPSIDTNCRIIIRKNHEAEFEDVHYLSHEVSSPGSHCLLPDKMNSLHGASDSCLPSSTTGIRNYCLHRNTSGSWQELRSHYLIDFSNRSIDSYYLRRELRFVMGWCAEGDAEACEQLSNICVLTLKADSFPCHPFLTEEPPKRLFHAIGNSKVILERRGIPNKFKLSNKDSENNRLNFIFARYTLKGVFTSYSDWISPCSFFKNVRFGVNGDKICWTSAKNLIDLPSTFYVPYLSFIANDDKNKHLYPLPVLVKNESVDIKDPTRWLLLGKLFMVDTVTGAGVSTTSENLNLSRIPELEIVRYVKSLTIQVRAQERKERGKIFPPLIILEYGELTQDDIEKNVDVSIEYKIIFKLTEKTTNLWIKIGMGVAAGLSLLYAIFCTFSHYRRNNNNMPILNTVMWFIIYYCGSIGTEFLIIASSVCLSAFIFYKGQTVLHILLPTENTEKLIKICAITAFSAKLMEIIALVLHLRSISIFFIDWEIPRCANSSASYESPHTSLRKSYNQRFPKEAGSQAPSEVIAARRNRTPSKSSQASTPSRHSTDRNLEALDQFSPNYIDANFSLDEHDIKQNSTVSMWRMYGIANEWLKIRTRRKINLLVHVLGTLFLLEIVGLKSWALAVPSLKPPPEHLDFVKESFTLKIAVGALTYILSYSMQLVLSLLYTRYYHNRLHGFVDLCSVSNISIFILTHEYYGHYIHGRSVHGFADTDLLTVINDLKREEDNLCAHRGLIPGTTDQTFVICVSKTFKSFYDSVAMRDPNERKFSRRHAVGQPNWDERWKTHLTIKKFLSGFLDHCFKNVEYTIKERHLMEKLLDTEFMDTNRDKSIFYIDKKHSFDQAIFYGNEWALATFEASVFMLILGFGGSYVLSAVATIFLSAVIELSVKFEMKKNLASKTLIDERFLMT